LPSPNGVRTRERSNGLFKDEVFRDAYTLFHLPPLPLVRAKITINTNIQHVEDI